MVHIDKVQIDTELNLKLTNTVYSTYFVLNRQRYTVSSLISLYADCAVDPCSRVVTVCTGGSTGHLPVFILSMSTPQPCH
jgi:hypothetical protein